MKLTIPLTGTVSAEESVQGAGDFSGDPNDPVRPVDINLGNVSWEMVSVDLENETMEIEVTPSNSISEPTGETNTEGELIYTTRKATPEEKDGFLQYAKDLVNTRTKDELYALAKRPRFKRPFKEKE